MAIGMLFMVSATVGCSLGEALVDGVFGGISDTLAALVSQAALELVSSSTQ
jgi:hypothetical protein